MANEYFDPGGDRAGRVQQLFTRIAARYDLINDLQSFGLHRRWKRRVVELAEPGAGRSALDVCCGTGDIGLALAHRGVRVTGLDFNPQMLSVAERRIRREIQSAGAAKVPLAEFRLVRADAQRLPFPDDRFDIVTVGYGLRNLADWERGLGEMERVARPGGRVVVLDFGKPDNPVWRRLYYSYLRVFVPVLGWVFCGSASAYSYILESLRHFPAQHGIASAMTKVGLAEVRIIPLLGGVMTINFGRKPRESRNFPIERGHTAD